MSEGIPTTSEPKAESTEGPVQDPAAVALKQKVLTEMLVEMMKQDRLINRAAFMRKCFESAYSSKHKFRMKRNNHV